MDELLKALQSADSYNVERLAKSLFVTKAGKLNKPAINYFTRYAPCRVIYRQDKNSNCLGGHIDYHGAKFAF